MTAHDRNLPATANRTKAEAFVGEVLPAARFKSLKGVLPAHVKPERFGRNLTIAVGQHPKLLQCDPLQVFAEVSKAAALGLLLDPQLGEAYLITGLSNGQVVPQLRLGYRGLMKLARQSGEVANIYAHEVCANDRFTASLGTDKKLVHEPDFLADRGEPVLYYAVVHFKDGATDFEPMTLNQIHGIRDRSDGWKAFKAGKIKSTPWGTDEGEMAKKTVLRRLLKRIPQSPELADALRIEDEAEYSEVRDVTLRPAPAQTLAAEAALPPAKFEIVDAPEPVEVEPRDAVTETHAAPLPPEAASQEPQPEPPSEAAAPTLSQQAVRKFGLLEDTVRAAATKEELTEAWSSSGTLRSVVAEAQPERVQALEETFNARMALFEDAA